MERYWTGDGGSTLSKSNTECFKIRKSIGEDVKVRSAYYDRITL